MSERQNYHEDEDTLKVKASNMYGSGSLSAFSNNWKVINPSFPDNEKVHDAGNGNFEYKYNVPWYGKHLNFWGHPDKKWFKSPVLLGSSLISIFLIMLIVVPALGGISIPYPDTSTTTHSFTNHESIISNFLVSNSEYLSKGNAMNYFIRSDVPVSFIISTQPINLFPRMNSITGSNPINLYLPSSTTHNYQYYLFAGDKITYSFSSDGNIHFSIFDPDNILNNGYVYDGIIENGSSTFTAPYSGFWTFSFSNFQTYSTSISGSLQYSISSFNISQANVYIVNITNESNSYNVPLTGEYYFSILDSNPNSSKVANLNNNSTPILTYEIDYHQNLTANERWQQLSLFIIGLLIITSIIFITGFFQRKKAILLTKNGNMANSAPTNEQESSNVINENPESSGKPTMQNEHKDKNICLFCGKPISHEDSYCSSCGRRTI